MAVSDLLGVSTPSSGLWGQHTLSRPAVRRFLAFVALRDGRPARAVLTHGVIATSTRRRRREQASCGRRVVMSSDIALGRVGRSVVGVYPAMSWPRQEGSLKRASKNQRQTLRMRLKPEGHRSGPVDGSWWPRSRDLHAELPRLLPELSGQLGPVNLVMYDRGGWSTSPRYVTSQERAVKTTESPHRPSNAVRVVGLNQKQLLLLVIPHDLHPDDAHSIMTSAANRHNTDAPERLSEILVPDDAPGSDIVPRWRSWDDDGGDLGE